MAFTQETFAPVGAVSTDSPTVYSYRSSDGLPVVTGSNYFVDKVYQLSQGDLIIAYLSDGDILLSVESDSQTASVPSYLGTSSGNVVNVIQESDFGVPSGGAITLVDDTCYLVLNDIAMTNRLICGSGNTIRGMAQVTSVLTYAGTGNFITTTSRLQTTYIDFGCPSATFLDADATAIGTPNQELVLMKNTRILNCAKFGNLTNIGFAAEYFSAIFADGFSFFGSDLFTFNVKDGAFIDTDAGSSALDLGTATFGFFALRDFVLIGSGTGISGAASSANIPSGKLGTVRDVDFSGMTTPLATISPSDIRWRFSGNPGVGSSQIVGETYYQATSPPQVVTITTPGTFESIGGTDFASSSLSHFTASTAGVLTYIGEGAGFVSISGFVAATNVGGGADEIEARVGINGVAVSEPGAITDNNAPTSLPVAVTTALASGDTVEIMVTNNSDTSNVEIYRAQLGIIV